MKSFVICGTWGEYDDFTRVPMFVCHDEDEAIMFVEALNNKEEEYFEKVIDFFEEEQYVSSDIYFEYHSLEVLKL